MHQLCRCCVRKRRHIFPNGTCGTASDGCGCAHRNYLYVFLWKSGRVCGIGTLFGASQWILTQSVFGSAWERVGHKRITGNNGFYAGSGTVKWPRWKEKTMSWQDIQRAKVKGSSASFLYTFGRGKICNDWGSCVSKRRTAMRVWAVVKILVTGFLVCDGPFLPRPSGSVKSSYCKWAIKKSLALFWLGCRPIWPVLLLLLATVGIRK